MAKFDTEYYFLKKEDIGCEMRVQIDKTSIHGDSRLISVDYVEKHDEPQLNGYFCGGFYTRGEDIDIHNKEEVIAFILRNTNEGFSEGEYKSLRHLCKEYEWVRDLIRKSKEKERRIRS